MIELDLMEILTRCFGLLLRFFCRNRLCGLIQVFLSLRFSFGKCRANKHRNSISIAALLLQLDDSADSRHAIWRWNTFCWSTRHKAKESSRQKKKKICQVIASQRVSVTSISKALLLCLRNSRRQKSSCIRWQLKKRFHLEVNNKFNITKTKVKLPNFLFFPFRKTRRQKTHRNREIYLHFFLLHPIFHFYCLGKAECLRNSRALRQQLKY